MPKFVTIGYGDRAGYDRTPKEIRSAAHAHEAEMKKRGALIGRRRAGASPQSVGGRREVGELHLHVVGLAGRRLRGD
jgi:hypothetical protein